MKINWYGGGDGASHFLDAGQLEAMVLDYGGGEFGVKVYETYSYDTRFGTNTTSIKESKIAALDYLKQHFAKRLADLQDTLSEIDRLIGEVQ